MSQTLRWGILGTGMIAKKFAAQMPQAQRSTLAVVGSRSADTAQAFTSEFGGRPIGSYDELLADPEVDAVYNSLPNGMHHEWSIKAMRAGKHVLCEKPFASNVAEAEEMFGVAEETSQVLVEAFMYRCHPAIQKLIETVRGGAVGTVRVIRSNFTFNREDSLDDARYQKAMAGGSIMDVGCYCVNLTRAMMGSEPTEMSATAHIHSSGVDDYAAGTLRFGDDVLTTFTSGMIVNGDNSTFVGGSEGYIAIDTPWFCDGTFRIVKGDNVETVEVPSSIAPYALEADTFAGVVCDGDTPWITREDTLGNQRVLDELRKQVGVFEH